MTRYKELRRMQAALKHRNREELEWAQSWARARLAIARRKDHAKTWRRRLDAVQAALAELAERDSR